MLNKKPEPTRPPAGSWSREAPPAGQQPEQLPRSLRGGFRHYVSHPKPGAIAKLLYGIWKTKKFTVPFVIGTSIFFPGIGFIDDPYLLAVLGAAIHVYKQSEAHRYIP